jgi:hypothetical protein
MMYEAVAAGGKAALIMYVYCPYFHLQHFARERDETDEVENV